MDWRLTLPNVEWGLSSKHGGCELAGLTRWMVDAGRSWGRRSASRRCSWLIRDSAEEEVTDNNECVVTFFSLLYRSRHLLSSNRLLPIHRLC